MSVLPRRRCRQGGFLHETETTRRATNCFRSRGMKIIGHDKRDRALKCDKEQIRFAGKITRISKTIRFNRRRSFTLTVTVCRRTGYSSLSDFGLAPSRFFSRIYDDGPTVSTPQLIRRDVNIVEAKVNKRNRNPHVQK